MIPKHYKKLRTCTASDVKASVSSHRGASVQSHVHFSSHISVSCELLPVDSQQGHTFYFKLHIVTGHHNYRNKGLSRYFCITQLFFYKNVQEGQYKYSMLTSGVAESPWWYLPRHTHHQQYSTDLISEGSKNNSSRDLCLPRLSTTNKPLTLHESLFQFTSVCKKK